MPTMTQAGVYSAVRNYLRGVEAVGSTEALPVVQRMQHLDLDDAFMRNGTLRRDGQAIHDMLYVRVKRPEESKGSWDYCSVIERISAEASFKPLAENVCA
jgi:branched-chain amino acid transport system substrate-binding protein